MKRKPKDILREAKALTDPFPEFVSLVQAGAQQVPLRVVKAVQEPDDKSSVDEAEIEDMTKVKATKQDNTEIQKFVFKADQFDSEDAVRQWLDEGGYEDAVVQKTDDGFVIENTSQDFEEDSIREIDLDDGITVFAGRLKVDKPQEDPEAEHIEETKNSGSRVKTVQPVAQKSQEPDADDKTEQSTSGEGEDAAGNADDNKDAEISPDSIDVVTTFRNDARKKFDEFAAMFSDGKTIAEVSRDATADGVPPAMFETITMFVTAMRNSVLAGDANALPALGQELGQIMQDLIGLFGVGQDAETEEAQRGDISIDEFDSVLKALLMPEMDLNKDPSDFKNPLLAGFNSISKDEDEKDDKENAGAEASDVNSDPETSQKSEGEGKDKALADDNSPEGDEDAEARKTTDTENAETTDGDKADAEDTNADDDPLVVMAKAVTKLSEAVSKIDEKVSSVEKKVEETGNDLDERVKGLENPAQTRKSAELEDTDGSTEAKDKGKERRKSIEDPLIRGALGISGGVVENY